jgi:lipopolysaccharide export system permease protein
MRLIQRYLFRQLMGHTLVATAALTGVAVLTASLSALDILVNDRQSLVVFAEVTLLATPQILAMILPLAVCVAGLVGLNRLHTEQEIVICFAGGMSRWRVAAPAIRVAALAAVLNLVINLWVQPASFREMRQVLEAVRTDIATTLIRPGEFTHPSPGLTVFAQSMDSSGEIKNVFIDQSNRRDGSTTYMAAKARIAKRDGAPVMILHNGSIQRFSKAGVLDVLYFDENIQDLRPFLKLSGHVVYQPSDRYLHELFFPDLRRAWERANVKKLYAEGHGRLATPLYNLAFMALALAAVLGGAFSRLGYAVRIAVAAAAGVAVRVLGFVAGAAAEGNLALNLLQYVPPVTCFLVSLLIVLRQHPARGPRRAPGGLATAQGPVGAVT